MAEKPKKKRKKKDKPGPKEERLVITDPQRAINALLNKKPE